MADTVVAASLTLNADQANQSVASFKSELKKAQQEVISLTEKFGATSAEATNAAKRAAELKDRIGDAKKLVDSFNPDEKFRGFTQVLTGVAGGFSAITGAMGLLGAESQDVQKQLLKVQSALAITQGLNSIGDSIQSFKNLGATLIATLGKNGLIGVAIIGVTALGAAFLGLFDNAKKATESEKALTDSTKDYSKAAATAIEDVTKVQTAFELARKGVISKEVALREYNDTLGDSLGKTNNLATAEKNLADKADSYIKITGLKAQANALFAKSAELTAQSLIDQQELEKEFAEAAASGAGFIQNALKKAKESGEAAIASRKQQAQDIEDLGAGLLKQAETIAKSSGIISKTQNTLNAEAAKAAAEAAAKAKEQAKKDLDQARKDREEEIRLAAQKIGQGPVISGLAAQAGKTPEEIEIERVAAVHKHFRDEMTVREGEYTNDYKANADFRKAFDQIEFDNKQKLLSATGNILTSLSELVGQQTAAGKVFAIAQATIDTYAAAAAILRNTARTSAGGLPGFAIAQMVATIVAGLLTVRKIVAVQVPGGGASGGATAPSAPLIPQPQVATTALDQQSLNAVGSATNRAYVLESDVSNNQERIVRLNRAAKLGG